MSARPAPADVSGWTVSGRHGTLGSVVSVAPGDPHDPETEALLVCGGSSHVLFFHVPWSMVRSVAPSRRSLSIDADIADFTAHLREDGSIDLFPAGS